MECILCKLRFVLGFSLFSFLKYEEFHFFCSKNSYQNEIKDEIIVMHGKSASIDKKIVNKILLENFR